MNRLAVAGIGCLGLALVGYALGTVEPYPGRELSLVGVMTGFSLFFVGRGRE